MKKSLLFLFTFALFVTASAQLTVTQHTLSNGLKVWLNEDHTSNKAFGAMVVKAGAIDAPGTGIAHYFEHIAFKGTDKIGTLDYAAEKPLLDSIAMLYDTLAITTSSEKRLEVQQQINRLSVEAAKYVIPNEFDKLTSKYGGSSLNAYTSFDVTVYHNPFVSSYIEQWCEINSERLLNPVFRMFQSELETVYEEKNMYDNELGSIAFDKVQELYFSPSPYAYSIIGTTENLKNPRMSEMRAFFDKFYNAANMELVMCGNFNTEKLLPILERTFGRIPRGEKVEKNYPAPREFKKGEQYDVKVPIPIVRAKLIGWRGLKAGNDDILKMDVAMQLLNNNNSTGYLDSLSNAGKVMMATVMSYQMGNEGMLGGAIIPNLIGGSMKKAEAMFFEQIERLKRGDIDPTMLESAKLSIKRGKDFEIENLESRADVMIKLITMGKSWDDYLGEVEAIEKITTEDIKEVANRYFTDNYAVINKKTGDYPKERLSKPNFEKIAPGGKNQQSEYAKELEKIPTKTTEPKFLDFGKDVTVEQITPQVKFYGSKNSINDIFTLGFTYQIGKRARPELEHLSYYIEMVGSDSMKRTKFNKELQKLGARVYTSVEGNSFRIYVQGYEKNFEQTVKLFTSQLKSIEKDDKKIKQIADNRALEQKAARKSNSTISSALLNYVIDPKNSSFLNNLTASEIRKLKATDFASMLDELQKTQCDVYYYGKKEAKDVVTALKNSYDFSVVTQSKDVKNLELKRYSEPTIFFIDTPKATQAIIRAYIPSQAINSDRDRVLASVAGSYIGGGMNSLLFQEIREFRSLAYAASGSISAPAPIFYSTPALMQLYLSTQNDKAEEAIAVVDSIVNNLEYDPIRLQTLKTDLTNNFSNYYPEQRQVARDIVGLINLGYNEDMNKMMYDVLPDITTDNLEEFFRSKIVSGSPIIYTIVGDSKKMDMTALSKYGKVERVKIKDIIR